MQFPIGVKYREYINLFHMGTYIRCKNKKNVDKK